MNNSEDEWTQQHWHCINCYKVECMTDDVCCEMTRCRKCGANMHLCKLEDHMNEVCLRVSFGASNSKKLFQGSVKCPLCQIDVVRDHMSIHLRKCNSFTINCNFCWSRSFVSLIAKRFFKRVAKEFEDFCIFDVELNSADSEILMTLQDQVRRQNIIVIYCFRNKFLARSNVQNFAV